MPRTTEATTDDFQLECIQQYSATGDQRSVTIEQSDTGNGLYVSVDGELVGHYSPIELAEALGAW